MSLKSSRMFYLGLCIVLLIGYALTAAIRSDYIFYAGYSILQFMMIAIAWNILGGYGG